jgi:tRNA(Arg) A34 adenosine deaminase TadA
MTDIDFMHLAIESARQAIAAGQMPVGGVVVLDGQVLLSCHNTVWADLDPSAHAEMNGIRRAAKKLGRVALNGCTVYCTLEPCPMCLAACHWAKVERIVYGADIADAKAAGFSELQIPAAELARLGGSPLRIEGGILRQECRQLFDEWFRSGKARPY